MNLLPKKLLHLYFSAGFLQLSYQSVSISLADTFLDRLGSTVNQVLGFFQTKTGQVLNDLHHLQLVGASSLQDNVERGLLFNGSSATTRSRTGSNGYSGSRRLDTVFFLQDLS